MTISKESVQRLAKQHPHSASLLKAFVPLLKEQDALARQLPPVVLPALDRTAFAQGRAWLPVLSLQEQAKMPDSWPVLSIEEIYLDVPFFEAAPNKLASVAAKNLPEIKEGLRALGALLARHPDMCRELAGFRFKNCMDKVAPWAKQHAQDKNAAALMALHLAATATRRVALAAQKNVLPSWGQSYCPICGSRPHGSCLKHKEGYRYLQCSLCRHEWQFSRTTCPACRQDSPKELPLFFLENRKQERGEGCNVCKHYLLGVDMREFTEDAPLELYLLCMMPLDVLMQEKGFTPVVSSK